MSLIEQIRQDQITARIDHDRDKATLLTTLLGEAQMVGKDDGNRLTTDMEVVKIVQTFIKGNNEIIKLTNGSSNAKHAQYQINILEQYLPKQLTDDDIGLFVDDVILDMQELHSDRKITMQTAMRDMGKIMGLLKKHHAGQYDGKTASIIIKQKLSDAVKAANE